MTKERVSFLPNQQQGDYNFLRALRMLLKNKPFIVLCIVSMFLICFQMYTQTIYNYLFKNFYEKPELYGVVTVCTYLPMALFQPVMGKLVRRFGKKEIWALVMDVIDYHELLSNRREEGTSYSIYSFVRKLGQSVAGAGVPAILGIIGYNGELATQSSQVLNKLYTAATLVPAIILICMFVLLAFCYKLSKKELEKLHNQLQVAREK